MKPVHRLNMVEIPIEARESDPKGTGPAVSAYLRARREWDERYGDFITRAKHWRAIGLLCAAIAIVEAIGLIALSMRSKTIPYVVAVDSLGRVADGIAEENFTPDDRLKRAALSQWISDLRSITNDGVAQRNPSALAEVYRVLSDSTRQGVARVGGHTHS
jgi:type IV secretion system protein TrbF